MGALLKHDHIMCRWKYSCHVICLQLTEIYWVRTSSFLSIVRYFCLCGQLAKLCATHSTLLHHLFPKYIWRSHFVIALVARWKICGYFNSLFRCIIAIPHIVMTKSSSLWLSSCFSRVLCACWVLLSLWVAECEKPYWSESMMKTKTNIIVTIPQNALPVRCSVSE